MIKTMKAITLLAAFALNTSAFALRHLTVDAKPGAVIQPTMYGIFFEDINFGADGGLYAEMVENRSFEFPQRLMGWQTFGDVTLGDVRPAFDRNPHYVTLRGITHHEKATGVENNGFFGMGFKQGMTYEFSVYARLNRLEGKRARNRGELVGEDNVPMTRDTIVVEANRWKR